MVLNFSVTLSVIDLRSLQTRDEINVSHLLPKYGKRIQIVVALLTFSGSGSVGGALHLSMARFMTPLQIDLRKPFHDANWRIVFNSSFSFVSAQSRFALVDKLDIQAILCRHRQKLLKLIYCPVLVSLRNTDRPSGDIQCQFPPSTLAPCIQNFHITT